MGSTQRSDSTADTSPTSSPFRRRASLLSIRTLLPQYSVVNALESPESWNSSAIDREPPQYSLHGADLPEVPGEFRYSYPINPKKPWMMLHLYTRDTLPGDPKPLQSRPRMARFWSCDTIRGIVELNLDSPQNIQRIDISLNGKIVVSPLAEGCRPFLEHEVTIWNKSMGDPLVFSDADAVNSQKKEFDGRFAPGRYTFPFSFSFPSQANDLATTKTVNTSSLVPKTARKKKWSSPFTFNMSPSSTDEAVSSSSQIQPSISAQNRHSLASPLPQSFMEKGINSNVAYEISVRVVHGRLRANSKIRTSILYFPTSRPLPVSQKRREAYEAGGLLPYPIDDPEGWFALETFTISGVINADEQARHTKADCTLYLSQPLSYSRGSVIPCFLAVSSNDERVVHLLSSPNTPIVRLLRHIRHPIAEENNPSPENTSTCSAFNYSLAHFAKLPGGEMSSVNHEVGRAVWWLPSKSIVQSPNVRYLEGEIHLNPSLHPSCDLPLFQLEYTVEMLSFDSDKFEPETRSSTSGNKLRKQDNVLASNPVEITTLHRQDEPIPTVYSEPPKTYIMRRIDLDEKAPLFEEDG